MHRGLCHFSFCYGSSDLVFCGVNPRVMKAQVCVVYVYRRRCSSNLPAVSTQVSSTLSASLSRECGTVVGRE
jgi:hypothetical protein